MKLELLFPDACYLYGDLSNSEYLARCLPEAELIKTGIKSRPAFMDEKIDMIFMGSMTERAQELARDALEPCLDRINELIEAGTVFLITGNAMEVFGKYIENEDGSRIPMLGLFDFHAKRQLMNRFNSLFIGRFGDIQVVGFKCQGSHCYGSYNGELFYAVRGGGMNPDVRGEGVRRGNFFATYVLGPLLVLNPPFTKYILGLLGCPDRKLAFEEAAMDSYLLRSKEFFDPATGFPY